MHGTTLLAITYIPQREALSFSSRCCILPACYQHHVQQQGPKIKKAFGRRSCDIIGPPSRYIKIIKEKNNIAEAVRKLNYINIHIYIYMCIVLNTHTYTRMCIYISLSLCACMDVLNSAVSRTNSTCYTRSQDISGEQCASDVRVVEPQIPTGGKTWENHRRKWWMFLDLPVAIWLAIRIYQRVCQLDSTGITLPSLKFFEPPHHTFLYHHSVGQWVRPACGSAIHFPVRPRLHSESTDDRARNSIS